MIGYVYHMAGVKHIGRLTTVGGIEGYFHSMRQKAHIAQTKLEAARDAVKVAYKTSQAHTAEKRRERAETGTAAGPAPGGAGAAAAAAGGDAASAGAAGAARASGRGRRRRAGRRRAVAPSEEAPSELAEKAKAKQAEMMLAMFEMMWRLSVVDIESTLRSACHKVLYDHSVDVSERLPPRRRCASSARSSRRRNRRRARGRSR